MEQADKIIEQISIETMRSLAIMRKTSDNEERKRQAEIVNLLTGATNNIFAGLESLQDSFPFGPEMFLDDE